MCAGSVAAGMAVGVGACAGAGGSYGSAGSGFARRDEQRLVGSYAEVVGVAVSRRLVFAATPSGIAIYDRAFNAWMPPLTRANGFTDDQITFMAADPVEDAVWFGAPGAVVVYRPSTEQIQRTIVTGIPDFIAFERGGNGDAIVRASGAWTRVSRVGMTSPLLQPPPPASLVMPSTLEDVYRLFPGLRGGAGFLLRDQRADRPLRTYPVVSGAISPERTSEVWLGTAGDGLYRVDPAFQQATPLRYGPIETDLGALALAADGVWMAGLGQSPLRSGLSFASDDLQRWRWIEGTIAVPLAGVRAYALAVRGPRLWMATDRGVVRVRTNGGEDVARWTSLDGLPDDRVYAIAPRADALRGEGAWAGTARGLVWVSDSTDARDSRSRGLGERALANVTVYALQPVGDTLWIGTSTGLAAMTGRTGTVSRVVGSDPALRRPVRALAWSDTLLLLATDDAVLRLAPRGTSEPVRIEALDVRLVGEVTRVAVDERSIVLAGSDGVIVLPRGGAAQRVLRVGADLPAPAMDVVLGRDWLWVATPAGLARFRRAGDGGLP